MSCETLDHDFGNLRRFGRADWRCPKCGENVMLLLVLAADAGIDLTDVPEEARVEMKRVDTHGRVLCISCLKPIHVDHLGGVTRLDGEEAWFHDNIACLIQLNDLKKHLGEKPVEISEKSTHND